MKYKEGHEVSALETGKKQTTTSERTPQPRKYENGGVARYQNWCFYKKVLNIYSHYLYTPADSYYDCLEWNALEQRR